jgi:hypothetical protein
MILLCVARRVIVPMQTILCTLLLRRFLVCPCQGIGATNAPKGSCSGHSSDRSWEQTSKEWISMCPQCQEKEVHGLMAS